MRTLNTVFSSGVSIQDAQSIPTIRTHNRTPSTGDAGNRHLLLFAGNKGLDMTSEVAHRFARMKEFV